MKKLLALVLAIAMVLSLAACGASTSSTASTESVREINLWATGSENVQSIFQTLCEMYNKSQDKYEVKLNFMLSGTGAASLTDGLQAAWEAKQSGTYDLVDLSGSDLSKVWDTMGADAWTKLDTSKIPNAASVTAKSSTATEYCQPYRGTTVIFAYDSEKVTEVPTTWAELEAWMQANPGRFDYNQPGTGGAGNSFAETAVYNFLPEEAFTSSDASWKDQWQQGFDYLASLNEYMYQSGGNHVYVAKNQGTLDLLNQGEIDMCPNWADMVLSQRASGQIKDTIKIFQLKEQPLTGSLQSLAIPTFSGNVEGAYDFINFMLSPEAQQTMVTDMAAIPLIDTSSMDMTGYEDLAGLDVSSFRISSIGDLETDFFQKWDEEIATIG